MQPNVKWPGGEPPRVTWEDFDTIAGPWLRGDMFADKVPPGYWPLPACDGLFNYDSKSQRQYWAEAATHFDQNDWLPRSPVFIEKNMPGRASAIEAVRFSADAAAVLASHPRVKVAVPIEDDQIQFASDANRNLIDPADSTRLLTIKSRYRFFLANCKLADRSCAAEPLASHRSTGLIPYVGAGGDERDVRPWAWLSFLPLPPPQLGVQYGPVQFIRWLGLRCPKDNA